MNKIIKIVKQIEDSTILNLITESASEQLLLERLTDLVSACEESIFCENGVEWDVHDALVREIEDDDQRNKKAREITDKIMLTIRRALSVVEYPENSELDVCPDCGNTIDKGACFYCKMD